LALLVSGILGSLLGGFALFAFGFSTFDNLWKIYPFLLRLAGTLAVLSGLLAHFYETNTSQLREARAELKERQFHEERMKKVALEAQLSSLESRVQPHFLFNTLNSISALIARDPRRAEELVGRLASLLRSSLNMTQRGLIPLDAELDIVRQYLEIERTRFSNRLRCSFDMSPEVGQLLVPPFAVQSLVENAIKHAVETQDTLIDIQVVAAQTTAGLRIEICDTGPGFDLSHVEPGHGLDNLIADWMLCLVRRRAWRWPVATIYAW
jgi:LytS/YehU family sensor histidine kinase